MSQQVDGQIQLTGGLPVVHISPRPHGGPREGAFTQASGGWDSEAVSRGRAGAWQLQGEADALQTHMAMLCPSLAVGLRQPGGSSQVNEVAFSPDESHCATCSDDGSVRVWCVASTELLIQFQVLNQVFSAATGLGARPGLGARLGRAWTRCLLAWLLQAPWPPSSLSVWLGLGPAPSWGVLMFSAGGPQSCLCLAWSPLSCRRPEEQYVAAGYSDGALRIFSIPRTAVELKMYPHAAALTALAFSADGEAGLLVVARLCLVQVTPLG